MVTALQAIHGVYCAKPHIDYVPSLYGIHVGVPLGIDFLEARRRLIQSV